MAKAKSKKDRPQATKNEWGSGTDMAGFFKVATSPRSIKAQKEIEYVVRLIEIERGRDQETENSHR